MFTGKTAQGQPLRSRSETKGLKSSKPESQSQTLPLNEDFVWVNPHPEEEPEALFYYREEKPPRSWIETMTSVRG
jgi:hypothetical protein